MARIVGFSRLDEQRRTRPRSASVLGEADVLAGHLAGPRERRAARTYAATSPEFQASLQNYPSSAVASPHLFTKVAVPGICGD
jgi:hypothetical protein